MSARLITGRPLIAGIGNDLPSADGPARRRPGLASSSGRPRNPSPPATCVTRRREPCVFYTFRQVPRRLMPVCGRSGTSRGQAAGRDLCRGAVRSAALRGGPAGRRWRTADGRPGVDLRTEGGRPGRCQGTGRTPSPGLSSGPVFAREAGQLPASKSRSRSANRSRIRLDSWISGLGGWRIASGWSPSKAGNAGPWFS
jgi:hypothetical protein